MRVGLDPELKSIHFPLGACRSGSPSLAVVVAVQPTVHVLDIAVPHARPLSSFTFIMSELCPVYAPFFGAMVRTLPAR